MTTIAIKDGFVAADTQATDNNIKTTIIDKIVRLPDGRLATGCGSAAYLYAFWHWLEVKDSPGGEDIPAPRHSESVGIEILLDGTVMIHEGGDFSSFPEAPAPFYAYGSGSDLALGAMAHGASAEEALKIAARYEIFTSEPITVYEIGIVPEKVKTVETRSPLRTRTSSKSRTGLFPLRFGFQGR